MADDITPHTQILLGQIVEEEITLTLDELSGACSVERTRIVELVEHGLLDAGGATSQQFSGDSLRKSLLALRLQRDLDINVAGASLVVELLERISKLEAQLRAS